MGKYDPEIHHRRSMRLREYDYCKSGWYFVTLCTHNRECLFGTISEGEVLLNDIGRIVSNCWMELANHFPYIRIDEYIVMPNHLHGIIIIDRGDANLYHQPCRGEAFLPQNASPLQNSHGTVPGSLSAVIQNLKSIST